MPIATLINRACTITRRSGSNDRDVYGDETPAETDVATVCEIQQADRRENDTEGELAAARWVGFFLPGEDIALGDQVTLEGQLFEVIGEPWHARNPRTQAASHIEATLMTTGGPGDPQGS